ncbi:MAG TPA: hypothetical protein VG733_03720, partial [Chthoniobacteraceae bacterium]|nr:hypothetical protein [Chthoniobacteraceae bacterium]
MPEFVTFHPALALSTDDSAFSSLGAIPGLLLFVVVFIIVGICMAASSQRRSWEGATVTVLVWFCAGLLIRPWTYFTNGPSRIETDAYWTPLW